MRKGKSETENLLLDFPEMFMSGWYWYSYAPNSQSEFRGELRSAPPSKTGEQTWEIVKIDMDRQVVAFIGQERLVPLEELSGMLESVYPPKTK